MCNELKYGDPFSILRPFEGIARPHSALQIPRALIF